MRAQDGVLFLLQFSKEEREKAVEIAAQNAPSGAFKRAMMISKSIFGRGSMGALTFAKGTRWLAVVRQDEGEDEFCRQKERVING